MPQPFLIGKHTREMCQIIDRAIERFLSGESVFLQIKIPFRHGKSDIVSRALPAYFLGRCAALQPDVIMSGYGSSLVEGFSKQAKKIIRSKKYEEVFPEVKIGRPDTNHEWAIEGSSGVVTAVGLGGAVTGKGGHLIIVDDFCKSRAEARSETMRQSTWESFANDILTRRAPHCIVIVCATPWHRDDVHGRIKREMEENPDFPRFEEVKFPAREQDGNGGWRYLFTRDASGKGAGRFDEAWYRSQYATLGKLSSGLLDCDPAFEGGSRFMVDRVVIHNDLSGFPSGVQRRAWDLASSSKERDKDDPDWTFGVKGLVTTKTEKVSGDTIRRHALWVSDVVYCQSEAPERDALIRKTAIADGPGCRQVVEAFGAYKDAYTTLKRILFGVSVVTKSQLPGDKSAKAAPLEPVFEAGEVHILRAAWNAIWIKHFMEFPDGAHDDAVDATAVLFHDHVKPASGLAGV